MEPSDAKPFQVETVDGREINVKCPICGNDTFSTARPEATTSGVGFQHVITGREFADGKQTGPLMALPIKFQYCANCGYIIKFLLTEKEQNK
jgi:ribosomal protein L37E